MPRSFSYSALTLRVKNSGESNREAWFLTAEEGLLKATVFGGPKSRLRAQVAPFHEGTLWIYHDPVRDSRKVTDFDARSYRTGIRELYERAMAADAVAQTILSSHGGGGSWPAAFKLAGDVLDALACGQDGPHCSRIGIYFLWYWANLLGVRPDLSAHASDASDVSGASDVGGVGEEFSAASGGAPVPLGPGARLWLNKISSLPPSSLVRVTLDNVSLKQAGSFTKALLAEVLGRQLPTWEGI